MIGFIDSGIGGVYVLAQCLKLCPNQKYIYLADNKNMPFGNLTKKQLIRLAILDSKILICKGCDVIVFACNTLTAAAIEACRKKFKNIKFVGIEPAVKPALMSCKNVLVLCTLATYKYSKFLNKYKHNLKLTFLPQKNLAKDIENRKILSLQNYIGENKYDAVVLGCTHYNYIRDLIKQDLGTENIFEASDGVARRLKSLVKLYQKQQISFVFSGKNQEKRYKDEIKKWLN